MARDPYLQASDAEDGESGFDEDLWVRVRGQTPSGALASRNAQLCGGGTVCPSRLEGIPVFSYAAQAIACSVSRKCQLWSKQASSYMTKLIRWLFFQCFPDIFGRVLGRRPLLLFLGLLRMGHIGFWFSIELCSRFIFSFWSVFESCFDFWTFHPKYARTYDFCSFSFLGISAELPRTQTTLPIKRQLVKPGTSGQVVYSRHSR